MCYLCRLQAHIYLLILLPIRVRVRVMIRIGIGAYVNVWVVARDDVMVTTKTSVRVRVSSNPK